MYIYALNIYIYTLFIYIYIYRRFFEWMVQFPTSNSAISHLMIPLQHRQKSRRFRRWPSKWKNYEVPITGRKPRDPIGCVVVVVFFKWAFSIYVFLLIQGWMLVNSGDFFLMLYHKDWKILKWKNKYERSKYHPTTKQTLDIFLSKTHLFSLGSPSCSLSWTSSYKFTEWNPRKKVAMSRFDVISKFEV